MIIFPNIEQDTRPTGKKAKTRRMEMHPTPLLVASHIRAR